MISVPPAQRAFHGHVEEGAAILRSGPLGAVRPSLSFASNTINSAHFRMRSAFRYDGYEIGACSFRLPVSNREPRGMAQKRPLADPAGPAAKSEEIETMTRTHAICLALLFAQATPGTALHQALRSLCLELDGSQTMYQIASSRSLDTVFGIVEADGIDFDDGTNTYHFKRALAVAFVLPVSALMNLDIAWTGMRLGRGARRAGVYVPGRVYRAYAADSFCNACAVATRHRQPHPPQRVCEHVAHATHRPCMHARICGLLFVYDSTRNP